MHHTNPYIAGPPVGDEARFQGRRDTIETILRAVRNPNVNSIAVSGPRQIGKSSLLRQLEYNLSDEDFIQVFFDLHGKSQLPLERLLYEVAEGIAAALAVRPPAPERFDPEGQFFSQTFLPALERRVAPQKIVLLFDEFDAGGTLEPGQAGAYFLPFMLQQPARFRHICFIFALGRNAGQTALQSRFNLVERLSRLSYRETELIIRQSEQQQSLYWRKDAIKRIWEWTRGHPFLTQLICKVIWESLEDAGDPEVPIAELQDIDAAIADALSLAGSLFDFIWRSLRPEERQVVASLATSKNGGYTRGELLQLLQRNQPQIDAGALETALRRLSDTDVVQAVDDGGNKFNFSIPLFWYWIAANHAPRVQGEGGTTALPRHQPAVSESTQANNNDVEEEVIEPEYISGADEHASTGQPTEETLRNTLRQNPNHIESRIQLARLLLDAGRVQEAANVLQSGPWEQSTEIKDELVTALMARAENEKGGNQLATYRQILNIDPAHAMARERFENFGSSAARPALNHQKMSSSLDILKQPGGDDRREQHQNTLRDREITISMRMAEAEEAKENWKAAATIYEQIARKYPDDPAIESRLRHARVQLKLDARYREATDALRRGDNDAAKQILAEIIMRNPNYKDAPGLLLQATTGINISEIQQRLEAENRQLQSAKAKIDYLQNEIQRLRSDEWQNASAIQVAQEQIQKFQQVLREAEGKEKQYERKLADAQLEIQKLQTGDEEILLGTGKQTQETSPFGDLFADGAPAPGDKQADVRRHTDAQQQEEAGRQRAEALRRRREAEETELRKEQESLQAEAARQRAEALRRQQELETARLRQEQEQKQAEAARQREEALRRREEMETARLRQEQEQEQKQAEAARQREEALRRREEMEAARLRQEQEQKQAEAARQREEALRRRQEMEAARLRQEQEQKQAEAARQREEALRRRQEMEAARLRQEQEQKQAEAARQREEALRRRQEMEAARLRQEQEQKQAEAARQREEALRRRQEMETARLRQEQEQQQQQAAGRQSQPRPPRRNIETAWQRPRPQTPSAAQQTPPQPPAPPAEPRDSSPPGVMPTSPQSPGAFGDRPVTPREPLGPRKTPAWQSSQPEPPAAKQDLPPRPPGPQPPPEEPTPATEHVSPEDAGLRPGFRRPLRPVEAKAPGPFTISRSHPALDAEHRRVQLQASWIMGTLLWLPAFIWLLWSWYVSPFAWEKDSRFTILVGVLISWVLCSRYGASNRKEITAIFLYLAPVIAHVLAMDILSEFRNITLSEFRRVGGVPAFTSENQPLIIIGATVYLLVISMIAALSGEAALAAVLGLLGGAAGGAILFLNGGGAIESTFVLTFVVTTTMLLRQTDLGTSTSAGVMVGVPAGFLVFAMTGLVAAESFHASVIVGFFSYAGFLGVATVVYLLVRLMRKLTRKSPFE